MKTFCPARRATIDIPELIDLQKHLDDIQILRAVAAMAAVNVGHLFFLRVERRFYRGLKAGLMSRRTAEVRA